MLLLALVAASPAAAQDKPPTPAPALARADIATLATLHLAINTAHDSASVQLALAKNSAPQPQLALREKLDAQIAGMIHHAGLTESEYAKKTFLVNTDPATRKVFDSLIVVAIGGPLPGTYVAPAGNPVVAVPAGPVGVHLGHVMNAFGDTPNGMGLLPTALAEARIAVQHATLAARQPANLDYMKLHAGHVINALDPGIVAAGPGLKYGLKKASLGVATHVELAAAAEGASPGVVTHAKHVALAARNTVGRSDQLIILAQKIQASTSAADAAALVSQMVSLADQLIAGFDANADGKVGMEPGEGGLQQCDEHMKLMLRAA